MTEKIESPKIVKLADKAPEKASEKTWTVRPIEWLNVESLDIEAQGVAHKADGKVVFIDGALPFEVVSAIDKHHFAVGFVGDALGFNVQRFDV